MIEEITMFTVTATQMETYKQRYIDLDKRVLDTGMKDICDMINEHRFVSTLFCCTGHPDVGDYFSYVCTAVSDTSGEEFIREIYIAWLHELNAASGKPKWPELEISPLWDPTGNHQIMTLNLQHYLEAADG